MSVGITAKLVDGKLRLFVFGAKESLKDDAVHRTRDVALSVDLLDNAAIASAQASVAPLTRPIAMTDADSIARKALENRRAKLFPGVDRSTTGALAVMLQDILSNYNDSLEQMLNMAVRHAENAAYENDAYDEDGAPIVVDGSGLSGGVTNG